MRALSPLVALVVAASLASADEWSCRTSDPEVDVAGMFYVDNDFCQPCMFSIWIYQESNGIPGLQRADDVVDDTDGGRCYPGDTIVF